MRWSALVEFAALVVLAFALAFAAIYVLTNG